MVFKKFLSKMSYNYPGRSVPVADRPQETLEYLKKILYFSSYNYMSSDIYTLALVMMFTIFLCLLLICICVTDTDSSRQYLCCSCRSRSSSRSLSNRPTHGIMYSESFSETREVYPNQRVLDFYGQLYLELNRNKNKNPSAPPPNYHTIN